MLKLFKKLWIKNSGVALNETAPKPISLKKPGIDELLIRYITDYTGTITKTNLAYDTYTITNDAGKFQVIQLDTNVYSYYAILNGTYIDDLLADNTAMKVFNIFHDRYTAMEQAKKQAEKVESEKAIFDFIKG